MVKHHGDSDAKDRTPRIFSAEKTLMDYTTVKGIHQRTGVDKDRLVQFVLKELLDNAVDFIEKFGQKAQEHVVKVALTKGKIVVANSNFGIEPFTDDMIYVKIFDFAGFYSEKRNIYKISRGYLGDALKEVLCVPYALADLEEIEGWNEPLIITGNKTSYSIHPKIDRVGGKIPIEVQSQPQPKPSPTNENMTSIEFHYPDPMHKAKDVSMDLVNVLIDYGMLNPQITFEFDIYPDSNKVPSLYAKCKKMLPRTQEINSDWANRPSAWYYSLDEFKQFINGLEDNDAIIWNVLNDLKFKEITNVPKDDKEAGMTMTVSELKSNPKRIKDVYDKLRPATGSMKFSENTKLKTQFDINKEVRRDAIKKRIEQFGYNVTNTKYRLVHDIHEDREGEVKFPFIFEIGMFYVPALNSSFMVDGINCSYRPNPPFHGKYSNTYVWSVGKKDDRDKQAGSIGQILEKYGYSNNKKLSKKTPAFIVINLISPRVDYEGYSKSHINLTPFSDTIAQTVYKIASESAPYDSSGNRLSGKDIVKEILTERRAAVANNRDLLINDKWTQSSVFYRARKRMLERGVRLTERKTITAQIGQICDEWKIKRESIGIFAADRAQLYFRGEVHDVGIAELNTLKQRGTDLIIIEKEGVCEVLSPFAEKYGIAILNTRGFLTDYATELSKLSEHVAVLSDLDDSGLMIATKVSHVPRIGIDYDTLDYFGLEREQVEEKYKPGDHYTNLLSLSEDGKLEPEIDELLPEVDEEGYALRIEIDSVLAEVDDNERFWQFILDQLEEFWPDRNYTRAIQPPKGIVPDVIKDLNKAFRLKCNEIAADKRAEIDIELKDYSGYIDDVDKKDEEIAGEIKEVLLGNDDIKAFLVDIEALKQKHPFLAVTVDDKEDPDANKRIDDDAEDLESEKAKHQQRKNERDAKIKYVTEYLYKRQNQNEKTEFDGLLFNDAVSVDYVYNILKRREQMQEGQGRRGGS